MQAGPANGIGSGIVGAGLDDETAAGGLLSVDGNIGLLGIIKDEDSCQDSDFSGDEGEAKTDLAKELNSVQEKTANTHSSVVTSTLGTQSHKQPKSDKLGKGGK